MIAPVFRKRDDHSRAEDPAWHFELLHGEPAS
jgi:hypothetical protein